MASLADWIKSQTQDYGQLKNAYPNAVKFGSALKKGISQLVPTKEDLNSPQKMGEWGLSAALNAPMGLMFVGPKSAGWDAVKASEAEKLLNAGVDPAQVWKEHLIGRMPDKSLFSEISDSETAMLPLNKENVSHKTINILDNPELLNNYPDLNNIYFSKGSSSYYEPNLNHIKIGRVNTTTGENPLLNVAQTRLSNLANRLDAKGMLNDTRENKLDKLWNAMYEKHSDVPITNTFNKSDALHELQHAIQQREGWARGGSPEKMGIDEQAINDAKILFARISKGEKPSEAAKWMREQLGRTPDMQAMILAGNGKQKLYDMPSTNFEAYKRLTGEAQARATQDRMNMNMQQRRESYPLANDMLSDIPLKNLINRYGNGGPSMNIDNPNLNTELLQKYLSTGKLSPENKSQLLTDAQKELPDFYNATIKDLKKKRKPIDDSNVYALLKTKLLGRQQYFENKNTPKIKLWSPTNMNETLSNLGFENTGSNISGYNDLSSMSSYYKHPQTGTTVRLSDHPPAYARSTGNDIQLYPGSYQSDDDALNSILSLIGRK